MAATTVGAESGQAAKESAIRGYVSIPTDQAWFFTPEWLTGEREADEDMAAGRGTAHESAEAMFAHLDALSSSDD